MVCRNEQYKCKAIVHESLREYPRVLSGGSSDITMSQSQMENDVVRVLLGDIGGNNFPHPFRDLTHSGGNVFPPPFGNLMLSECFAATNPPTVELFETEDASVTCSFCRSDIWSSFLTSGLVAEHEEFRLVGIQNAADFYGLRPLACCNCEKTMFPGKKPGTAPTSGGGGNYFPHPFGDVLAVPQEEGDTKPYQQIGT
ncbi:hypothetical protein BZA05DRAFT_434471 [Tricharina praecox]|uniref:uncharacterized protein n=1 Tax=Tricharina praecox TaxID=43433 RepID=UPI002220E6E2|nr:uncharacterized protein BZA05DRAFT_434471 [Tricharina praecox]KAI5856042.1 hypothetical protein BZA05DRAFT_434471 [Tricharina praecox]